MKKILIICGIVLFVALLVVLGFVLYPRIYFDVHFECEYDEVYQAYALTRIKNWNKETLTLPERTPDGELIEIISFSSCTDGEKNQYVKEFIIPDTYKMINGDISSLASLERIHIGKNLMNIGYGCFSGNDNLVTVTISPEHELYYSDGNCVIEKQSKALVSACNGTVIPDGVKIIGNAAFAGLKIDSVFIPDSVETIESSAFALCETDYIFVPDSVKTAGKHAFDRCYSTKLYCEAETMPEGWDENSIYEVAEVHWGVTKGRQEKTGDGSLS